MEYEKAKINRLINYKDKIIEEDIKNDLEWILGQYNEYYINDKDFNYREKNYNKIVKKYYNSEDEKDRIKEELNLYKRRYKVLKKRFNTLLEEHKICCKKIENMI